MLGFSCTILVTWEGLTWYVMKYNIDSVLTIYSLFLQPLTKFVSRP